MTRSLVFMCIFTAGCILHREKSNLELRFEPTAAYDCPHARDVHDERCEEGGASYADKETVP